MLYDRYCPSTIDKIKYPHLRKISKCWQTKDGMYDILYEKTEEYEHLLIQRIDNQPIHNYMDLQEIKNDLLGEDVVAVEIYPKKDDLMNGANVYHLWTWEDIKVPNLKNINQKEIV